MPNASARAHGSLLKLTIIALVVLATGCITIEEHYTFKKNGSGTMEYVMDMSAFRELMKSLPTGEAEKNGGKDDLPRVGSALSDKVKTLKQLAGIKKVKLKEEQDGYVERVSFAFADLPALNRALNVLMPDSLNPHQEFFRWEGNALVRKGNSYANQLAQELTTDADSAMQADLLSNMKYKFSFAFAKPVGEVALAEGITREDPKPKTLELATDWSVLSGNPRALDMRITLAE